MKKCSTVIACKRNLFDFWNSCKLLQNFVNVEALLLITEIMRHWCYPHDFAKLNIIYENSIDAQ